MPRAKCKTPEKQIRFELYKLVHKCAVVFLSGEFCMITNGKCIEKLSICWVLQTKFIFSVFLLGF